MPYVRHPSILQRAPRLRLGGRGMGDAQCPSLEQLQGVVDMNDPCQNPIASLPISTLPQTSTMIAPAQLLAGVPPAPSFLQTLSQTLAQYQTPLLIGGGILAAVLVFGGRRR